MVKARMIQDRPSDRCDSCNQLGHPQTYQFGFGNEKMMKILTLCPDCAHELMTKTIQIGGPKR